MKQMIEAQTQLTQLVIQSMTSNNSNGIPMELQQLIGNHTQMVQMMSRIMEERNKRLTPNDPGKGSSKPEVEIRPRACKTCGEIGHTSRECHGQCPNCETSHPTGECPMSHVTCFLCEGNDHVPAQCHLCPMVKQWNQPLKDTSSKKKVEPEGRRQKTTHSECTKCCYICEGEGHISSNCTKKRERHHTVVVGYEDHELQALLDLEKPKKKMKGKGVATKGFDVNKKPKRDLSHILCFNCHEPGHYADKCPERLRQNHFGA